MRTGIPAARAVRPRSNGGRRAGRRQGPPDRVGGCPWVETRDCQAATGMAGSVAGGQVAAGAERSERGSGGRRAADRVVEYRHPSFVNR